MFKKRLCALLVVAMVVTGINPQVYAAEMSVSEESVSEETVSEAVTEKSSDETESASEASAVAVPEAEDMEIVSEDEVVNIGALSGKTSISDCDISINQGKLSFDKSIWGGYEDENGQYIDDKDDPDNSILNQIDLNVSCSGNNLERDKDYTAVINNLREATGTYSITITGKGDYTGQHTIDNAFTIMPKSISDSDVKIIVNNAYDNDYNSKKALYYPDVSIIVKGVTLDSDTDYTLDFNDNDGKSDEAWVSISGNGNYTGTAIRKFKIYKNCAGVMVENPYPDSVTFFDETEKIISENEVQISESANWTVKENDDNKYTITVKYFDPEKDIYCSIEYSIYFGNSSATFNLEYDSDYCMPVYITVNRKAKCNIIKGSGMENITLYDENGKQITEQNYAECFSDITVSVNDSIDDTEYYEIYYQHNYDSSYTRKDIGKGGSFEIISIGNSLVIYAEKKEKVKFHIDYENDSIKDYIKFSIKYWSSEDGECIERECHEGDLIFPDEYVTAEIVKNTGEKAIKISYWSGYEYLTKESGTCQFYYRGLTNGVISMVDKPRLRLSGTDGKITITKNGDNTALSDNAVLDFGDKLYVSGNSYGPYIVHYSDKGRDYSKDITVKEKLLNVEDDVSISISGDNYYVFINEESAVKGKAGYFVVDGSGNETAVQPDSSGLVKITKGTSLKIMSYMNETGKAIRIGLSGRSSIEEYYKGGSYKYKPEEDTNINIMEDSTYKIKISNDYKESVSFCTYYSNDVYPKHYIQDGDYISKVDTAYVIVNSNSTDKYLIHASGTAILETDDDSTNETFEFSKIATSGMGIYPEDPSTGYYHDYCYKELSVEKATNVKVKIAGLNSNIYCTDENRKEISKDGIYSEPVGSHIIFTDSSNTAIYKVTPSYQGAEKKYIYSHVYNESGYDPEFSFLVKDGDFNLDISEVKPYNINTYSQAVQAEGDNICTYYNEYTGVHMLYESGNEVTIARIEEKLPENVNVNLIVIAKKDDGTIISKKELTKDSPRMSFIMPSDNVTLTSTMVAGSTISVNGIQLDKNELALETGKKEKLHAYALPENATNKTVGWSSSDASAAIVADGTVTGVKAGTAVITARTADGGYTASCTVTVKGSAPTPVVPTKKCIVTFDSQSGNSVASATYAGGDAFKLPAAPSKAGCTFGGWFTDENGHGTQYTTGTIITKDVTLYAYWISAEVSRQLLDISTAVISAIKPQTYDGSAKKPVLTVKYGNKKLEEGVDYIVDYSGNVNAGTATAAVMVTGIGNYMGTKSVSFDIKKKKLTAGGFEVVTSDMLLSENKAESPVKVYDRVRDEYLVQGTDYTVTYDNEDRTGTAKAVINGAGNNYESTISKAYKIFDAKYSLIASVSINGSAEYVYTG